MLGCLESLRKVKKNVPNTRGGEKEGGMLSKKETQTNCRGRYVGDYKKFELRRNYQK